MSYKIKTTCRACQSTDLKPVFDLGVQPLANDHKKPGEPCQGFYPLAVNLCGQCGLAQLSRKEMLCTRTGHLQPAHNYEQENSMKIIIATFVIFVAVTVIGDILKFLFSHDDEGWQ